MIPPVKRVTITTNPKKLSITLIQQLLDDAQGKMNY